MTETPLMIENITLADITQEEKEDRKKLEELSNSTRYITHEDENTLEENSLKYTCNDCNFVTSSKRNIDEHIETKHLPEVDEDIRFECSKCKQELTEAKEYDNHMKTHDKAEDINDQPIKELENMIFNLIIESFEGDITAKSAENIPIHMETPHDEKERPVSIRKRNIK